MDRTTVRFDRETMNLFRDIRDQLERIADGMYEEDDVEEEAINDLVDVATRMEGEGWASEANEIMAAVERLDR